MGWCHHNPAADDGLDSHVVAGGVCAPSALEEPPNLGTLMAVQACLGTHLCMWLPPLLTAISTAVQVAPAGAAWSAEPCTPQEVAGGADMKL